VVHNKLGEMQMVGAVNVTGKNTYEFTWVCNYDKEQLILHYRN
jgi:hypothetical protein